MHPRLLPIAMKLLTRLPVGDHASGDRDVAGSVAWFSIVGALIGGVSAFVWWSAALALPRLAAATLAVLASVVVTGAIHEGGVGAAADGLFGGHDPDSRLAVMARPARGSFGVVAVTLLILLKASIIAAFSPVAGAAAIVVSASLSRGVTAVAMVGAVPALEEGPAATYLDDLRPWAGAVAGITGVAATALLAGLSTIAVALGALTAVVLVRRLSVRQVGGITADVIGAMILVSEVVALAILSGLDAGRQL